MPVLHLSINLDKNWVLTLELLELQELLRAKVLYFIDANIILWQVGGPYTIK